MAQPDQISVNIPEADLTKIQSALSDLESLLHPYLRVLTHQERLELPKMGDKTVAFVQKALEYAQQNAELVPPYLDLEAFQIDVDAVETLHKVSRVLTPLAEALNDSIILSGSEAYQGGLVFYTAVKGAAKAKAPKAGSIYADLSARFPGRGAGKRAQA